MTIYRNWEYGGAVTGEPYVKIAKDFGISLNVLLEFDEAVDLSLEEKVERIIADLRQVKAEIPIYRRNGSQSQKRSAMSTSLGFADLQWELSTWRKSPSRQLEPELAVSYR